MVTCWLNDVMLEQVLHMLVNEGQLHLRMAPKLVKVWHIITNVNAVWENTGTTNAVL